MPRPTTRRERWIWMDLRDRYQFVAAMTGRGLSCSELAHYARCSKATIGHLRTGHLRAVTPALAARIEKALAVTPGTLFAVRSVQSAAKLSTGSRNAERSDAA